MALTINPKACPQNHRCPMLTHCPVDAISQEGNGLPVIDEEKCINCGKCSMICPMRAVQNKN